MSIYIGATGDRVRKLQKALAAKGFDPGDVDGIFGAKTRAAVIAFQRSAKLEPDGIVGPQTLASLGLRLDLPAVPKTRAEFRKLIVANPNYFGTLKGSPLAAVVAQAGNTDFEQLVCVGYEPALERLVAIVEVKQMGGYGGPLCGDGSPENLRFFVDWNNDGNWINVGLTRFTAHDIPEPGSLYYAVQVPLSAAKRGCKSPFLPRVRAILSWNDTPPEDDPNYVPPWGNALETTIQIAVRPPWIFETIPGLTQELIDLVNTNVAATIQGQMMMFGDSLIPGPALTEQLAVFEQQKIPPLRYAAQLLDHLAKTKSMSQLAAIGPKIEAELGISNLAALLEQWLEPGDGNQSYEELRCLGYDRDRQSLSAIVRIKRPYGYGGDLCQHGSREYVSFWVWDPAALAWDRLGTSSVEVHDIPVPSSGVDYEVFLPVDFSKYQRPCAEGHVALRIRAILSWNSVIDNPNQTPYWGGREEATVEVKPGPEIATGMQMPFIDSVGDMPVCAIDQATGFADGPGVITGGTAEDAPFGGMVTITGFFSNPPQTLAGPKPKYRLAVRPFNPTVPDSANPWQPLTNEFPITVTTSTGGIAIQTTMTQVIDSSDGYYTYQEVLGAGEWRLVSGRVLGKWSTSTPHGLYELRIEGKDAFGAMVATGMIVCEDGTTRQDVKVHLDNLRPHAQLRITGVIRAGTTTPVPASDCDKFHVGDTIVGDYIATDRHYSHVTLTLAPDPTPTPPQPTASPQMVGVTDYAGGLHPTGGGGTWSLDTTNMRPCGYTLTLRAHDRTIVGSSVGNNWRTPVSVGFCLETPAT